MHFFTGLRSFFSADSTIIDNKIFRLHYVASCLILLILSIILACKQNFGDPINCLSRDDIPEDLLNTFCWTHMTYTVRDAWEKKVGVEVPYPGVAKYSPMEQREYHDYYQWVSLFLLIQAVSFCIPRYFWASVEGGRIKNLIKGFDIGTSEETKMRNRKMLVDYMLSKHNNHNYYVATYILAEVMNFTNVLGQISLINAFLGGGFITFGSKIFEFAALIDPYTIEHDPALRIFPRVAKCTFHRYGSSGDVQRHDAMCLLPINVLNEKIFIFLWFWFVVLAVFSGAVLMYRVILVCYPKSRLWVTRPRARISNQKDLKIVLKKCKLGDWLIFYLLSQNLDLLNFSDIMNEFARRVDSKDV